MVYQELGQICTIYNVLYNHQPFFSVKTNNWNHITEKIISNWKHFQPKNRPFKGTDFDQSKLPSGLHAVVEKLQSLPGYPLGSIRDVTVNIRFSEAYQILSYNWSWKMPMGSMYGLFTYIYHKR